MTIIDRARDALDKANKGPWHTLESELLGGKTTPDAIVSETGTTYIMWNVDEACSWSNNDDDVRLAALAPELAAEVVRLHERFRALADELDESGGMLRDSAPTPSPEDAVGRAFQMASFRIRGALEGVEE